MGAIFGVTEMVGWSGFEGAPCSLDRVALLHLPVLPIIFKGFANRRLLGNVDDAHDIYIYIYTIWFHVETSYRFASCAFVVFGCFLVTFLHMGKRKPPSWKGCLMP